MIFTKNYNAAIRLMCEMSPEFKDKYAELIETLPEDIKSKCKKGTNFYDGTYELVDQLGSMRFSIYDVPNNYINLNVNQVIPHTISWLDQGERTEVGTFEINDDEVEFYIEKVNSNKFKVIVTKNNKEDTKTKVVEFTYEELATKLDATVRATSIKQMKK